MMNASGTCIRLQGQVGLTESQGVAIRIRSVRCKKLRVGISCHLTWSLTTREPAIIG